MVILLRCNDLNPDPRVDKYIDYYESNGIKYKLIGWNRGNEKIVKKNTIFYEEKAVYGGKSKNIIKKIKWGLFLIKELIINLKEYEVIHACDVDTAFPALIMKLFGKKIVFDVFDWIGNSNFTSIRTINKIIKEVERFTAKNSDYIIICEEGRRKQMCINHKNIKILPNIPVLEQENVIKQKHLICENIKKFKISYVGVFDECRNIEQLLLFAKNNNNIEVEIGGFGSLQNLVEMYANENENINYRGKVNYNDALNIMSNSDLIYAMYCKSVENHIFAAPNKYYESLMLAVPLITTNGTLVGNKTLEYCTGFVIGEDYSDLNDIFEKNNLELIINEYSLNCKLIWNEKYKDYVKLFMENEYKKMLGL